MSAVLDVQASLMPVTYSGRANTALEFGPC